MGKKEEKSNRFDRMVSSNFGYGSASISLKALILFTEKLLAQIRNKNTVYEALDFIYNSTSDRTTRMLFMSMATSVKAGNRLSQIMLTFTDLFPNFYIAVMMVCERTGKLMIGLEALSGYLKYEQNISNYKRMIKSYIMLNFYTVSTLAILVLIQVKIISFTVFGLAYALLGFLGIIIIRNIVSQFISSDKYSESVQSVASTTPIYGKVYINIFISKFCNLFNIFNELGLPFIQNIELTTNYLVGSPIYDDLSILYLGLSEDRDTEGIVETVNYLPKDLVEELSLFKSGKASVDSIKRYANYLLRDITEDSLKIISILRSIFIYSLLIICAWIYLMVILNP